MCGKRAACDVGYVLFPCGQIVDEVTGELRLYYGAADSSIAVAHGNINEMLDWLKAEPGAVAIGSSIQAASA